MSDLPAIAATLDLSRAADLEAQHLSTVTEQIIELRLAQDQSRARIVAMQDSVQAEREVMRGRERDLSKLTRRKRVFARAKFALEQIEQE